MAMDVYLQIDGIKGEQRGFWPGPNYEKEKPTYVVYRR